MPITRTQAQAAVIEFGRVLDVDMATYTLSVTTEFTKKPQTGITFATPYQHFVNGEGIYFMPEVGSTCWVCFPSDGNRPFVLAWAPPSDEGDFRARKHDLNPGDIYLGTRDENALVLRRGGVVELRGGPLCQRLFLPINNTIKDFCENYGLHTLAGDLEWTISREETTQDGERPALLSVKAREFSNDPAPIAELLIGSHDEGDPTILSLVVKDSGNDGAASQVDLRIGKDGTVSWLVKKDVTWKVNGKWTLEAQKDVSLKSTTGKVGVESSTGKVEVKGATGVEITSPSQVKVTAPVVAIGQQLTVGSGMFPVMLADPMLLTWLASHTHLSTAPGSATSPASAAPTGPPPTGLATSKVLKSG